MTLPPLVPPKTVLIVDDNPIVRRVAQGHLSQAGFRVFEAEDGQEALDVLGQLGGVDLVVADVVMPRMDGAEFIRRLLDQSPDQCVLYMSAYPAEILVSYGARALSLPFLAKPFSGDALLAKVAESLDRRDSASASARPGRSHPG